MKKKIFTLIAVCLICSLSALTFAVPAAQCSRFNIPDTDTIRFTEALGAGWNLGDTFEAHDENLADEMDYETVWCGIETTRDMIKSVKDKGFQTIRIPVSWHDHVSDDGTFTISEKWLARVNEVVDYGIDEGLYVILNIHHDDGKNFLYPSLSRSEQSLQYIKAIWSQLAARFADYDEHLLFESMNEPRLVGSVYEWSFVPISPTCLDAAVQINHFNQAFVDTVRAAGGNNASRYLLCPGYDASADGVLNPFFKVPSDPVGQNRVIVTVHSYTPYDFALKPGGTAQWSSGDFFDRVQITAFMDGLYLKFISRGTAVLLDEFGARDRDGNLDARIDYTKFYVSEAAKRGMRCMWWDNNILSGEGERFGLLNRETLTWAYPEIAEAILENS